MALVSAAGYGFYAASSGRRAPSAVRTVAVDKGEVSSYIRATGTVTGARDSRVGPLVAGRVDALYVFVGSKVTAGQRLFRVNGDEAALQLAADELAVAAIDLEIAQRERAIAVLQSDEKAGAEPREKVAQAQELLALDKVRRRQAANKVQLGRLRATEYAVTSPTAGVVTESNVRLGDVVHAGNPLMTISDGSALEILARMEQGDAHAIRSGMVARVSVDGSGEKAVEEKVLRIDPAIRKEGNADYLAVWLSLTASKLELKQNQQVDVRLMIGTRAEVNRVPLEALVSSAGKSWVWMLQGGRLRSQPVTTGMVGDRYAEVVAGLEAGQNIVVAEGKTLKEGDTAIAAPAISSP